MTARGSIARFVARITGGVHLERLADIDEKVGRFGRAQREELADQRHRLEQVLGQLSTRAGADAIRALERRIDDMQASLLRQDRTLSDVLERARLYDEQAVDDRRFARRLEQLLRHDRPVIVGPWTGEVGFELLYWVPFVRWAVGRYRLDPARLLVVSRGGVAPWYSPLASRYADVFSFFSPEEFRAATEAAKKQRRVGEFDARVVERVRQAHSLHSAELLHPGMMYRLFMPFWKELATVGRIDAYTEYARLGVAEAPPFPDLPDEYVAARFYFSDCFPDTPANRAFVGSTIETISRQVPVVLLNTRFAVDDHRDLSPGGGRVITLADRMSPEQNLAVQTGVISRARAFVGTYGGYSYLAPFCGVSSIGFYSVRTFKPHHLHLAQRVFERLGGPTLVPLDVADAPLVRLALAGALVTAS